MTFYFQVIASLMILLLLSPRIQAQLTYHIQEEVPIGTVIGQVAKDANIDSKYPPFILRTLKFRFLTPPPDYLAINETTGKIFTHGRIDRDTLCKGLEHCRIREDIAVQPIQYFQIIKIVIEIMDINDNRPVFFPDQLVHEMSEASAVGSGFVIPTARDSDFGLLGVQRYRLLTREMADDKLFNIQISTKLDGSTELRITLVKLIDRETRDSHRLKVIAYDGGVPPRNGTLDVSLTVLDANDNAPIFESISYESRVVENLPVFTSVARVHATDLDIGLNGQVTYSLSPSTRASFGQIFAVNNETGLIFVVGQVDFEVTQVFNLIVSAADNGLDVLHSETTVIVRVEDVNDNAPHITINTLYESAADVAKIFENAEIGSFVGHVIGRDPDKDQNGRFNCAVSDDHHFRLRQMAHDEYHVITAAVLDREHRSRYRLAFVCRDSGLPSLFSVKHLTVEILDVNDNAPKFVQHSYSVDVYENNKPGEVLLTVNATDPDYGENSELTYFVSETFVLPFTINATTGVISTTSSLDREKNKEFKFRVFVSDAGSPRLTSAVKVFISVLDVDDERPIFTMDIYSYHVLEHRPAGTEVGAVSARDADEYPFNQFHYFILPDSDQSERNFVIDGTSGRLITTQELDRESRATYSLLVVARSDKDSRQASTATITVHVTDINDNAPVFLFPTPTNSTVVIYDSLRRGQTVAVVSASDADDGLNAQVSYAIIKDGATDNLFGIHQKTGVILAKADVSDMLESALLQSAPAPAPQETLRRSLLHPPLPTPTVQASSSSSSSSQAPLTTNRTFSLTISATDSGDVSLTSRASIDVIVMAVRQIDRRSREGRSDTQTMFSSAVAGAAGEALIMSERNYKAVLIVCLVTAVLSTVLLSAILAITCPRCGGISAAAAAAMAAATPRKSAPTLNVVETTPSGLTRSTAANNTVQTEDNLTDSMMAEGGESKSSVMLISAAGRGGSERDRPHQMDKTTRKTLGEVCHVNSRARNKVGYSA